MSVWTRIAEAIAALVGGEGLSAVFDRLTGPPDRSVAFTIAVIALGAKMAKADGRVTRDEVAAFREVFTIAEDEAEHAARVFNLARQDVAGFDIYARRIARVFGIGAPVLADLIEGLMRIAAADGRYHRGEEGFLAEVAAIFGISPRDYRVLASRNLPDQKPDPYAVLGVDPDASPAELRAARARAVRDCHPDRLAARGLPEEAIRLAEARLIAVNAAWAEISNRAGAADAAGNL